MSVRPSVRTASWMAAAAPPHRVLPRWVELGLQPAVFVVLLFAPSVFSALFENWCCTRHFYPEQDRFAYFLRRAPHVECYESDEHDQATVVASLLLTLWILIVFVGLPALLMWDKDSIVSETPSSFADAISLLHRGYRFEYATYWELVDMLRRVLLMGLLLVVFPEHLSFLRLFAASLITNGAVVLQLVVQPYSRDDDNCLAAVASGVLALCFSFAFLVEVHNNFVSAQPDSEAWRDAQVDLLGFDSAYGFAVMLIVGAAIYLGIAILIVLFEFTAALAIEQQEKEEKQFHEAEINALKQRKRNSVAQVTGAFKPGAALKRQSSRRASTVKSPMEEALAILRPLAKTKAEGGSENDQQSKAINKALDIIASSASFNVNEEMLLRHALSYMRDNDTD
eukprot:6780171-Prymnesium_polylepis.1